MNRMRKKYKNSNAVGSLRNTMEHMIKANLLQSFILETLIILLTYRGTVTYNYLSKAGRYNDLPQQIKEAGENRRYKMRCSKIVCPEY